MVGGLTDEFVAGLRGLVLGDQYFLVQSVVCAQSLGARRWYILFWSESGERV